MKLLLSELNFSKTPSLWSFTFVILYVPFHWLLFSSLISVPSLRSSRYSWDPQDTACGGPVSASSLYSFPFLPLLSVKYYYVPESTTFPICHGHDGFWYKMRLSLFCVKYIANAGKKYTNYFSQFFTFHAGTAGWMILLKPKSNYICSLITGLQWISILLRFKTEVLAILKWSTRPDTICS